MESELKANLLALGASFQAATGEAQSNIWRKAAKDAWFPKRIEERGSFTIRMYDKIVSWFDENWPDGAVWPEDVKRPVRATSEAAE